MFSKLVTCLECGLEFKRINVFHLKKHQMDEKSYVEKYPHAKIFSDETLLNISTATKVGMNKPEARSKFDAAVVRRSEKWKTEGSPLVGIQRSAEFGAKISQNKERAEKISKSKIEFWKTRKGQTVEQLFGEETGKKIREIKSVQTSGENNPAFGKVYDNSGGSKHGIYKGRRFRSLYELSFILKCENEGMKLSDILYETISIPYEFKGVKRTYHPDFLIGKRLIEIKSTYDMHQSNMKDLNSVKFLYAKRYCDENNLTFEVITEKDLKIVSMKFAETLTDIVWIRK